MGYKKNGNGGVAFDAASGSGLAFLQGALELANTKIVQPLSSVFHARDIDVKFGGGFVEYLSAYQADYASTGGNQYGLQGTSNTDIPEVQVSVGKGLWKAWNWATSFSITYIQLARLQAAQAMGQPAPFSIQTLLENGVQIIWNKAIDLVVYLGWQGQPGLINNPSVVSSLAALNAAGTSRLWANKTPVEILKDINSVLTTTIQAGGYDMAAMPNRILVSYSMWYLLNQPMTTGGFSSLLNYIMANNVAFQSGVQLTIAPLPNPYITGQGAGSTERMVAYRKDDDCVYIHIPQALQKAMTLPTTRSGGAYETIYNACIGQLQWVRAQTAAYVDGIG